MITTLMGWAIIVVFFCLCVVVWRLESRLGKFDEELAGYKGNLLGHEAGVKEMVSKFCGLDSRVDTMQTQYTQRIHKLEEWNAEKSDLLTIQKQIQDLYELGAGTSENVHKAVERLAALDEARKQIAEDLVNKSEAIKIITAVVDDRFSRLAVRMHQAADDVTMEKFKGQKVAIPKMWGEHIKDEFDRQQAAGQLDRGLKHNVAPMQYGGTE